MPFTPRRYTPTQSFMKTKSEELRNTKRTDENDAEYREKKKEYCRIKMRELYQRKKALAQSITV